MKSSLRAALWTQVRVAVSLGLSIVQTSLSAPATSETSNASPSTVLQGSHRPQATILQRHGRSIRGEIDGLPFVTLRGNERQRGEAYGALCGRDVVRMIETALIPAANLHSPDAWNSLSKTVEAAFVFPEDVTAQMEGFMRGLRETSPAAARLPTQNRDLSLSDLKVLQAFADLVSSGRIKFGGCSSFSAWGALADGNQMIAGRNLDYMTFPARLPFLLIAQEPVEPGKQKTIEISIAGIFGASTALNEEGVLVLLHDEPGLPSETKNGWTPRILALRKAIETARASSAAEDVAAALREIPVVMGGNVHVSFPYDPSAPARLPAVIEWDGNPLNAGVTIRKPSDSNSLPAIFCTNHFLERSRTAPEGSTARRYQSMQNAAATTLGGGGTIGAAEAGKMMDQAAVRGPVSTQISVIVFPGERRLLVALAPQPGASATDGSWVEIHWNQVFNP